MSGVTFRWVSSPDLLAKRVGDYGARLLKAIQDLAQTFAAKIATAARANATWQDRTGNARQSLTGICVNTATGVVIYLAGLMSYSIWLEVANAGKYAVILRTLQQFYGPLMAAIRALIGV